jgi:hypothetical protein
LSFSAWLYQWFLRRAPYAMLKISFWALKKTIDLEFVVHDEALFKDPLSKEDCPFCFLPMPEKLIDCVSLPLATLTFVPAYEFAEANEGFALMDTEEYFTCCGKCICKGCVHSLRRSGNHGNCPYCWHRHHVCVDNYVQVKYDVSVLKIWCT